MRYRQPKCVIWLKFVNIDGTAACWVKAKFHYAIWSQTGLKLVADLQLVLDDRPNFCSLQVCDQLRTCLRPDSIMEFDFEPVCDQVRAVSICRDSSNLLESNRQPKCIIWLYFVNIDGIAASWVKVKFHYTIWLQSGLKLSQTCSKQKFGLSSSTSCRYATSFKPVCDQIA